MANNLVPESSELETLCPICKGTGGDDSRYEEDRWWCHNCRGAGFVPTEIGKLVLSLMRHNFKPMLRDATDE
jgi:DnaJ-class molecular chaperone